MNATKLQHDWDPFLKFYNAGNQGRPTRLGVFEPGTGAVADYWLECGAPFNEIKLSTEANASAICIRVGRLTHEVDNVVKLSAHFSTFGDEDGLDVFDAFGRVTILRFEGCYTI